MNTTVIVLTVLAFAVGTAFAWVGARRRMRERVTERMVTEAEKRLREEILRRVAAETAEHLRQQHSSVESAESRSATDKASRREK